VGLGAGDAGARPAGRAPGSAGGDTDLTGGEDGGVRRRARTTAAAPAVTAAAEPARRMRRTAGATGRVSRRIPLLLPEAALV
jgi:hypothetical protein